MPRLGPMSSRRILQILRVHGFEKDRQSGSHIFLMQYRMRNEFGRMTTIAVVVPDEKEVPVGTLRNIIKHSGLDRSYFE